MINLCFDIFRTNFLPVVAVFNVKEEEGTSHDHAKYGDGRQNAVQRDVDMAALKTNKRPILWRLHT